MKPLFPAVSLKIIFGVGKIPFCSVFSYFLVVRSFSEGRFFPLEVTGKFFLPLVCYGSFQYCIPEIYSQTVMADKVEYELC